MSAATVKARKSTMASFNTFLEEQHQVDETWPSTMESLTEEQANDRTLYERFAFWLTYTSESARGDAYALGTIKSYVRSAAQIMWQKFKTPGSNLSMLEGPSNWMTKIVTNMERLVMQREFEAGNELSNEAPALHLRHIEAIGAALSGAGTQEAAFRKLVIMLSFLACGRCGEVASLAWPLVKWDHALGAPILMWRDYKNSKDKPVVLLCNNSNSDGDIFLAFADAAAQGQFNLGGPVSEGENKFLFF